jgi:hypothetical protein
LPTPGLPLMQTWVPLGDKVQMQETQDAMLQVLPRLVMVKAKAVPGRLGLQT